MSPRPQYDAAKVASKRSAIVESALDQIAEHSPEAVRMQDIAEAAGLSVGTLQYYFGSRESLLVHAFSAHSSTVVEAIAGLAQEEQGTAWERLQSCLRAVPTVGDLRRRSQVWIELVAASARRDYLQASVEAVFTTWSAAFRGLIDIGIEDGSFRPQADVDLLVDILIAAIDGFDVAVAAGRESATPERIAASLELTAQRLLGVSEASGDSHTDRSGDSGSGTAAEPSAGSIANSTWPM